MKKGKIFVRNNNLEDNEASPVYATGEVISQDAKEDVDNEDDNTTHYRGNVANIYNASYEEISQFLLSLFNGNELTLKEVLQLAKLMFKKGVRTPEMAAAVIKKDNNKVNVQSVSERKMRNH